MIRLRSFFEDLGKRFAGRALLILSGSLFGQGIALITLPIISNLYSTDVIGRAASSLALMNILSMIVCLQYDQAIIVGRDHELKSILIIASTSSVFFALLFFFLLRFLNRVISVSFGVVDISFSIEGYFPVLLLTYTIFILLLNFRLRKDNLRRVSLGRSVYYGGGAILQVILGKWISGTEEVYIYSQILGSFVAILVLFPYLGFTHWCRNFSLSNTYKEVKKVFIEYKNFPKYQMGAAFINALSAQLPVLFLRFLFSETWAGLYFMASRLVSAPINLLSQAVGQIFYRDTAERERKGDNQNSLVENTAVSLALVSLLPSITIGVFSKFFVNLFLDSRWQGVGSLIQVLMIGVTITFIVSPLSPLLNVKGKQAGSLFYNIVLFISKLIGLLVGYLLNSAFLSVTFFSVGTAIGMILFLNYLLSSVGSNISDLLKRILPLLLGCLFIVALLLLSRILITSNPYFYAVAFLLICFATVIEYKVFRKDYITNQY